MRYKQIILALSPLLLFALLIVPYSWINQEFLVDWLGCGCPVFDEAGHVQETFNANDFTACFWLLVTAAAGIIAFFLSRRLFPKNSFPRILYTVAIVAISLFISYWLWQRMLWN